MTKSDQQLLAVIATQQEQIAKLTDEISYLRKMMFGSKTEKSHYVANGQQSLFEDEPDFFDPSEQTDDQTIKIEYERPKRPKGRKAALLEGLPIKEIHYELSDPTCDKCASQMKASGTKIVREEAEFIPASLSRVQHIEHAYECPCCKRNQPQLTRGKASKPAIQASLASPSVLAEVLHQKFELYVPLYRQVKEWSRHGLTVNDRSLANWVIRATEDWLLPLYERLHQHLVTKTYLHADETSAQVIHRSDGKAGSAKAQTWVFRTIKEESKPIIVYHASLSRAGSVAVNFLKGFQGYLHVDGYPGYNQLANVVLSKCWSHSRREWTKGADEGGKLAVGLNYCNQLFKLEKDYETAELTPEERLRQRQQQSAPIVTDFYRWMEETPALPGSQLGKAIGYQRNQKEGLLQFLTNGWLAISNNLVENTVRPLALIRKNSLFSTSEAGATANAVAMSLIETAKANGLNVYSYLVYLFEHLPNTDFLRKPDLLEDYLPWSETVRARCMLGDN